MFFVFFSFLLLFCHQSLAASSSHSASQSSEDESEIDLTLRLGPKPSVTKNSQNVSTNQRKTIASYSTSNQSQNDLHRHLLKPLEQIRKEKNSLNQRNYRTRMKIKDEKLVKQRDHEKYTKYREKILQGGESEKINYNNRRNAMNRKSYHQRKLKVGIGRKRNRTVSHSTKSSENDQVEKSAPK